MILSRCCPIPLLAFAALLVCCDEGPDTAGDAVSAVRRAFGAEDLPALQAAIDGIDKALAAHSFHHPEQSVAVQPVKDVDLALREVAWLWELESYGVEELIIKDRQTHAEIGSLNLSAADKRKVADLLGVASGILSMHKEIHDREVDGTVNLALARKRLIDSARTKFEQGMGAGGAVE